jgi:hypothetical protein
MTLSRAAGSQRGAAEIAAKDCAACSAISAALMLTRPSGSRRAAISEGRRPGLRRAVRVGLGASPVASQVARAAATVGARAAMAARRQRARATRAREDAACTSVGDACSTASWAIRHVSRALSSSSPAVCPERRYAACSPSAAVRRARLCVGHHSRNWWGGRDRPYRTALLPQSVSHCRCAVLDRNAGLMGRRPFPRACCGTSGSRWRTRGLWSDAAAWPGAQARTWGTVPAGT